MSRPTRHQVGSTTHVGTCPGFRSVAALALVALLALAAESPAQESERSGWAVETRAGIALPAGQMAEVAKTGPTVEIGGVYWAGPNVAVRADLGLDRFGETSGFGPYEDEGPAVRLWRTTAGVQFRFTEADTEGWSTILGVGGGAATIDTDSFLVPVTDRTDSFDLQATYPALHGRVRAGYEVTERLRVHAGVQGHLILASEEDTEVFEAATAGRATAFGTAAAFPLTVGVELGL